MPSGSCRAVACEAAGEAGWLAGLPVSIKDLTDVAGVRTTYGSPLFADHVPAKSHPLVERIERKGGIVMGKSNTPKFGAGGSTFNEVWPFVALAHERWPRWFPRPEFLTAMRP